MSSLPRVRIAALAMTTALVTAACGTTVNTPDTSLAGSAQQQPGGSSLGAPNTTVDAGGNVVVDPGTGEPVPVDPGTGAPPVDPGTGTPTDPSSSGTAQPGGGASQAPATGGKGPVGTAKGVTDDTIKIGVMTAQGFGDFAAQAGLNAGTGNQRAEAEAVIKQINADGGIAGRQIVPVFFDLNIAGLAANPAAEYQAACSRFTQDDEVYAVVSPIGTVGDTLYSCLTAAGVITASAGESVDEGYFEKFANTFYVPSDMNLTRLLSENVDALYSAGFFGSNPKIGVVLVDEETEKRAVAEGLVPALAKRGLKVASTFAASTGLGGTGQYGNAVLQFRTAGVTHVLFSYKGSALLFGQNASQQGYYPKFGLHSRQSPAALLQGSLPAKVLSGSMGMGWQQYNDVDSARDPGPASARGAQCLKLIKDSGQDVNNRVTALTGLWLCDLLFFMNDAVEASPDFSLPGFRAGAESLTRFESASTFRSGFRKGQVHDGAIAYRVFAFDDKCACFAYTTPVRKSPAAG